MSLLLGWGAYAWDKNTSARLCAKNAGGEGEAYLWDTMVNSLPSPSYTAGHEPSEHSSHTPLSLSYVEFYPVCPCGTIISGRNYQLHISVHVCVLKHCSTELSKHEGGKWSILPNMEFVLINAYCC